MQVKYTPRPQTFGERFGDGRRHFEDNTFPAVQVAIACHVPKQLVEDKEVTAKEWFETVTKMMGGEVEIVEESDDTILALCKGSKEKELFPLKMRDAGSSAGYQMLLKKGLIPQDGAPPFLAASGCLPSRFPSLNA